MDQVELYSKCNSIQKYDAAFVIDNYLRLIKWKANEAILDVGCGDGGVLMELLLPKLQDNFKKIIGVDLSDQMVKFAEEKCTHGKISFMQMDISANVIPVDFEEAFAHIVSFYCLHWVIKQRQALKNIYDMLAPGGDVLLTFLASNPIYDIYEKLSLSPKWSKYMTNLSNYISPYHHSENPEKEFETLLKNVGFYPNLCRVEKRTYIFPSIAILKKAVQAVNPFIKEIPDNEVKYYIEDYIDEVRKMKNIIIENCNNNNEEKIKVVYKLFVVYATKQF